jgi:hypothetical protein
MIKKCDTCTFRKQCDKWYAQHNIKCPMYIKETVMIVV